MGCTAALFPSLDSTGSEDSPRWHNSEHPVGAGAPKQARRNSQTPHAAHSRKRASHRRFDEGQDSCTKVFPLWTRPPRGRPAQVPVPDHARNCHRNQPLGHYNPRSTRDVHQPMRRLRCRMARVVPDGRGATGRSTSSCRSGRREPQLRVRGSPRHSKQARARTCRSSRSVAEARAPPHHERFSLTLLNWWPSVEKRHQLTISRAKRSRVLSNWLREDLPHPPSTCEVRA